MRSGASSGTTREGASPRCSLPVKLPSSYPSRGLQSRLRAHRIPVAQAHRGLDDVKALVALMSLPDGNGGTYFHALVQKASRKRRRSLSVGPRDPVAASPAETRQGSNLPVADRRAGSLWSWAGGLLIMPFRAAWRIVKAPVFLITWPLRSGRAARR